LLAVFLGLASAIAAGTALAFAAAGSGPVPVKLPLAQAIHAGLTAPKVQGITARITFTNHLIDASNLQGTDPLLQGASGRLWLSADHKLRLELQSDNGDAQAVFDNGSFWVYDPTSNTVYQGTVPGSAKADKASKAHKADVLPSVGAIQKQLDDAMTHLNLSSAIPSDVAGQAAYTVRISPKHDGGLLGDAELAWDATHGVPLRVAIYARGDSSPVLELKATDITYGAVSASDFNVSPPLGAKVVKVATPTGTAADHAKGKKGKKGEKGHKSVTGVAAVAKALPFKLTAPSTLVGLPRRSTTLLNWGGSPAALVTYGQNLGGIAVIEQTGHSSTTASSGSGSDHKGLSLPTVSVNGVSGQELDTALGTLVRFTRGGVSYIVVGSVPAAAAEAAARGL
jgi:outer membrane lipoprotein-sorting protein